VAGSEPSRESTPARRRGASAGGRIGLAVVTGAIAKGFSLLAQVVAVAIAVRALGSDRFALYVVIASLVAWISLAGLGVAPGLTLGVARAVARGDRVEEARLFVVALLLMVAVAALLIGAAVVLSASGIVEQLMVGWLGSGSGDASAALLCMAVLIALQLVVVVPEAAQLGLQSQHVSNLWAGLGSIAAIVLMTTFGGAVTSVTTFVLVSQGPQVAARAANGFFFVLGRRFLLRPPGLQVRQHVRPILGSGAAFAGFQIANYLGLQVGLIIMAATVDAASVALAGVIVRGLVLQIAGLGLVTTPTWPAIANAVSRGNMLWVRRAYHVLVLAALAYSSVVAGAILLGLEAMIGIWTGTRPADNVSVRVLLAVYVVVNAWAHVNAMTLVGLGALRFTAIILVAEAVLVIGMQVVLVPVLGVTGYVGALAVGAVLVSGWALGLRVQLEMEKLGHERA
jgi:O-antigen/teichoic acid export membrane protein